MQSACVARHTREHRRRGPRSAGWSAAGRSHRRNLLAGVIVTAWCAAWSPAGWAQPPSISEELMRRWDLNRDGKVDDAEAETARTRMRRARNEAANKTETDPITGRPRVSADVPAAGGLPPAMQPGGGSGAGDDGGLILVPGTGEPPPLAGPAATEPSRERTPLPGTRVPATTSTIPSVAPPSTMPGSGRGGPGPQSSGSGGRESPLRAGPGRETPGDALSSRARILPNGAAAPAPMPVRPSMAPPQQPSTQRPGIIAGGARPTVPPARATAVPQPLNAGRLPGGLPQTRGVAPGSVPGASSVPRPAVQPFGTAGSPTVGVPRRGGPPPTIMPPAGGSVTGRSGQSTASAQSRSSLRPPGTQPPTYRPPQTTVPGGPRPPRVGPQDFYGR